MSSRTGRGSRDPGVPWSTDPARPLRLAAGLVGIVVVTLWNRAVSFGSGTLPRGPAAAEGERAVIEHERGWRTYLRGFHAHHGEGGNPDRPPKSGDLWRGLDLWVGSRFLRGYTLGDDIYLCPGAPLPVRVHQTGHTPAFGAAFEPIRGDRRDDGGLPDEPLWTFDVMLPGDFPHTFLRLSDRRGLREGYREWRFEGRIARVVE